MNKIIIVAITLLGVAMADHINKNAETRNYHNDIDENGFQYSFDTTNGIQAQASGNINGISGSAGWVSPEGIPVQFSYIADENGYQPQSDFLPTSPPIPDYVYKALEYIRTHPPRK